MAVLMAADGTVYGAEDPQAGSAAARRTRTPAGNKGAVNLTTRTLANGNGEGQSAFTLHDGRGDAL
jgi:hypothetical protein